MTETQESQQERVEKLYKKVKYRYWGFSTGYVVCALGAAVSVGLFNTHLGFAVLFGELTYFAYVNMVNVGDWKLKLETTRKYLKAANVLPPGEVEKEINSVTKHGQYL